MGIVASIAVIKYNDERIINKKLGILTLLSWEKSPNGKPQTHRTGRKALFLILLEAPFGSSPLKPSTRLTQGPFFKTSLKSLPFPRACFYTHDPGHQNCHWNCGNGWISCVWSTYTNEASGRATSVSSNTQKGKNSYVLSTPPPPNHTKQDRIQLRSRSCVLRCTRGLEGRAQSESDPALDISYGVGSPATWYPPHSQGQSPPRVPQSRPDNLDAVLSSHPRNGHLFSKSSELINLQYMFRGGAPQGKENPAQGWTEFNQRSLIFTLWNIFASANG